MRLFINGAIAMACWVVGLFFLRFGRQTGDRLFLTFAAAFWVWSLEWTLRAAVPAATGDVPYVFLIRLAAFLVILVAIIQKNRQNDDSP